MLAAPVTAAWAEFERVSRNEVGIEDSTKPLISTWFASEGSATAYRAFACQFLITYESCGCWTGEEWPNAEVGVSETRIVQLTAQLLVTLGQRLAVTLNSGEAISCFERASLSLGDTGHAGERWHARETALLVIRVFATTLRCAPLSTVAPALLLSTASGVGGGKNVSRDVSAALFVLNKCSSAVLLSEDDGLAGPTATVAADTVAAVAANGDAEVRGRQRAAFGRALCLAVTQALASICPSLPLVSAAFASPGLPAHPWNAETLSVLGMPLVNMDSESAAAPNDTSAPPPHVAVVLREISGPHTAAKETAESQYQAFTTLVRQRLQRQQKLDNPLLPEGQKRKEGNAAHKSELPVSSSSSSNDARADALLALSSSLVLAGVMDDLVNILRVDVSAGTGGQAATFLSCFQAEVLLLVAALVSNRSTDNTAGPAFNAAGGQQALHDLLDANGNDRARDVSSPPSGSSGGGGGFSKGAAADRSDGTQVAVAAGADGRLLVARSERTGCGLALWVLQESAAIVKSDDEERKAQSRVRKTLANSLLPAVATWTSHSLAAVSVPFTALAPAAAAAAASRKSNTCQQDVSGTHEMSTRLLGGGDECLRIGCPVPAAQLRAGVHSQLACAALPREALSYCFCGRASELALRGPLARLLTCFCVLATSPRRHLSAVSSTQASSQLASPNKSSLEGAKGPAMQWVSSLFGFEPPLQVEQKGQPRPTALPRDGGSDDAQSPSFSSSSASAAPTELSFLQPVLRCLASLAGLSADGDEVPLAPHAVLTCLSRLLEAAPEDVVTAGAQADTWSLVFAFLRGGRRAHAKFVSAPQQQQQQQQQEQEQQEKDATGIRECCCYFEMPLPKESEKTQIGGVRGSNDGKGGLGGTSTAAMSWALVHDESLRVLHRVVLTSASSTAGTAPHAPPAAGAMDSPTRFSPDLRHKIVAQVARCLKHYATAGGGSDRLATLRCCRWLRAVLLVSTPHCHTPTASVGGDGASPESHTALLLPPLPPPWLKQGTGAEAVAVVAKLLLQALSAHKPVTVRPLVAALRAEVEASEGGAEGSGGREVDSGAASGDWPLHEALLGLLLELASGTGRDTVCALVCSRGDASSPLAANASSCSSSSGGGSSGSSGASPGTSSALVPLLPFLEALLDFASSPTQVAPAARRCALRVVHRLLTHSAARAAPAVRKLVLSSSASAASEQQQHPRPQRTASAGGVLEASTGRRRVQGGAAVGGTSRDLDFDCRGAEFALQRGRAMALRVLQTLANCFEAAAANTSAVAVVDQDKKRAVALDLIDCVRVLVSNSSSSLVALAPRANTNGDASSGGQESEVSVAVAEALQLFFRQAGGMRTLVSILAALACDRTPDGSVGGRGGTGKIERRGHAGENAPPPPPPSRHFVALSVLAACTALMRNRGNLQIGDRNKVSFRRALHALPLLSMDDEASRSASAGVSGSSGSSSANKRGGSGSTRTSRAAPSSSPPLSPEPLISVGEGGQDGASAANHVIVLSPLLPLLLRLEKGHPTGPTVALLFDMLFSDGRIADALDAGLFDCVQPGVEAAARTLFDPKRFLNFVQSGGSSDSTAAVTADGSADATKLLSPPLHHRPFTMQNHELVPVLVFLLPHTPLHPRTTALQTLTWLLAEHPTAARSHQVVCASLVQPPLLTALLDVFHALGDAKTDAISLATTLGQHNVTVSQLKRMFRLMNAHHRKETSATVGGVFRPEHSWRLVKSLQGMVSGGIAGGGERAFVDEAVEAAAGEEEEEEEEKMAARVGKEGDTRPTTEDFHLSWRRRGPHRYFLFDGVHSGLCLPLMPRWPATKGYTFSTWFRLEKRAPSAENSSSSSVGASAAGEGGSGGDGRGDDAASPSTHPASDEASPAYCPVLFSFKCRGENGVEVSLVPGSGPGKYTICLTVHSRKKGLPLVRDLRGQVEVSEGEWRFIAVSHTRSQFRTVSTVQVVVDRETFACDLSFPRFDADIRGCIGRRHFDPDSEAATPTSEQPRGSDVSTGGGGERRSGGADGSVLHGQMGAVYFFDEALGLEKLRSVYSLGPNYTYFFERACIDVRHHDDDRVDMDPASEPALDGSLTGHLMLAFNPSVYEGDAFLDNTPEKNSVSWGAGSSVSQLGFGNLSALYGLGEGDADAQAEQSVKFSVYRDKVRRPMAGHMHALRLGGTVECVTRDVRNTLDCLGGVAVLFPLFEQFDRPVLTTVHRNSTKINEVVSGDGDAAAAAAAAASASHVEVGKGDNDEEGGVEVVDYATEPRLTEWVLNLLGTLVDRNSAANESFLVKHGAFQMVGFFLEKVSPQHVTIPALEAMRRLTTCARWSNNPAVSRHGGGNGELSGGDGGDQDDDDKDGRLREVSFRSSAMRHLLANWALWVFAGEEVQLHLADEFLNMAQCPDLAPLLRSTVTLQWVLDGLSLFFWYDPPDMLLEEYDLLYPAPLPPPPKAWPPPPPSFPPPPSPLTPSKSEPPSPTTTTATRNSSLASMLPPSPLLRGSSTSFRSSSSASFRSSNNIAAALNNKKNKNSAFSPPTPQSNSGAASSSSEGVRPRPSRGMVRRLVRRLVSREVLHPTTRQVGGRRARKETVVALRRGMWAAVEALFLGGGSGSGAVAAASKTAAAMSEWEVCALLGFVVRAQDDVSRGEALSLLLRLVVSRRDHALSFARALAAISKVDEGKEEEEEEEEEDIAHPLDDSDIEAKLYGGKNGGGGGGGGVEGNVGSACMGGASTSFEAQGAAESAGATKVGGGLLLLLSLLRPAHSTHVRVSAFLLLVLVANLHFSLSHVGDGVAMGGDDDDNNNDDDESADRFEGTVNEQLPSTTLPLLFGADVASQRAVFAWVAAQLVVPSQALQRGQNDDGAASSEGPQDQCNRSAAALDGGAGDDDASVSLQENADAVFCDGMHHLLTGRFCEGVAKDWAGRKNGGGEGMFSTSSSTSLDLRMFDAQICLPSAFAALCSQLSRPWSERQQKRSCLVLHQLKALLSHHANRDAILKEPRWQMNLILVAVAALETPSPSSSSYSSTVSADGEANGDGRSRSRASSSSSLGSDDFCTASSQSSSPVTRKASSRQQRCVDYVIDMVCTLLFHSVATHSDASKKKARAPQPGGGGGGGGSNSGSSGSISGQRDEKSDAAKGGDLNKDGPPRRAAMANAIAEVVPKRPVPAELAPLHETLNALRLLATTTTRQQNTQGLPQGVSGGGGVSAPPPLARVESRVATKIGCEVLLGFTVRLRREMEVLSSRRSHWFAVSGPANSPASWSSTVSTVWHTVAIAVDFIACPPGSSTFSSSAADSAAVLSIPFAGATGEKEEAAGHNLEKVFESAGLPEPLSPDPSSHEASNLLVPPVTTEREVDVGFTWPVLGALLDIIEPSPASDSNASTDAAPAFFSSSRGGDEGVVLGAEAAAKGGAPDGPVGLSPPTVTHRSSSSGRVSKASLTGSDEMMPTACLFTNSSPDNKPELAFLGGLIPCAPQPAVAFSDDDDDDDDGAMSDSSQNLRYAFSLSPSASFNSDIAVAAESVSHHPKTVPASSAALASTTTTQSGSLPPSPSRSPSRWRLRQRWRSGTSSFNTTGSTLTNDGGPRNEQQGSLQCHAHLPWVLLRLLLNTATLGSRCCARSKVARTVGCGVVLGEGVSGLKPTRVVMKASDQSVPLLALKRLGLLLTRVSVASDDAATGLEVVFVVGTLVACLRSTPLQASSEWSAEALSLVRSLCVHPHYRQDLRDAFTGRSSGDGNGDACWGGESGGELPFQSAAAAAAELGVSSEAAVLSLLKATLTKDDASAGSPQQTTGDAQHFTGDDNEANDEARRESGGSAGGVWERWDDATAQDMEEMEATEGKFAAALSAAVAAGAARAMEGMVAHSALASRRVTALEERVSWAVGRVQRDEGCRLVEGLLGAERERRHGEHQWGRVREGLASERGPWGYASKGNGGSEEDGVFWMMDGSEDHLRCRHKLKRNPFGSKHTGAGQHSNTTNQTAAAVAATDKAKGVGSKVWKDLTRFQKKSEIGDPEDDENKEGEEGAEDGTAAEKREVEVDDGAEDEVDDEMVPRREDDEDDGWQGKGGSTATLFDAPVELLTKAPLVVTPGTLEVTRERIRFTQVIADDELDLEESAESAGRSSSSNAGSGVAAGYQEAGYKWAIKQTDARTWRTRDVLRLSFRHYSLRFVAMEIFFADHSVVMLNLKTALMCRSLYDVIANRCRPPFFEPEPDSPRKVLATSRVHGSIGLTDAWVQREITNFEYLMRLNTIAGRTYNDLAQYPIFPWVLADYTSSELDLSQPKTFRDLRYPIGVQHGKARVELQERYRELESMTEENDPLSAPFHYGCCYSNPAFVLWYLLRLEPFASLHIHLNDGHFDKPDRMFQGIAKAYKGCTTNSTDVKELIPEFFYQPDFLRNAGGMDLGTTQDGQEIGHVALPPWAKGDVGRFVRLHRLALESEFVSANLHHWIDLVFGFKQRPPAMINGSSEAVKACNVYRFYHYPDAFSMEEVEAEDPQTHEVWIKTANEFGQVPVQLFPKRPHPQRIPLHQADIIWPIASVVPGAGTCLHKQPEPQRPNYLLSYPPRQVAGCAVVMLAEVGGGAERLVTIDAARVIGYHVKERRPPDVVPPYKLKIDMHALNLSNSIVRGNNLTSSWASAPASSSSPSPPFATFSPQSNLPSTAASNARSRSTSDASFLSRSSTSASSLPSSAVSSSASSVLAATAGTVRERRLGVPFAPLRSLSLLRRPGNAAASAAGRGGGGSSRGEKQQAAFEAWPLRLRLDSNDVESGVRVAVASTVSDDLSDPAFEVDANNSNTAAKMSATSAAALPLSARAPSTLPMQANPFGSSSSGSRSVSEDMDGSGSGEGLVDDELGPHLFAVHGKLLFSCKHWDNSFKVTHLETGRLVQSVALHHDVLTCLHVCSEGPRSWLVTASCDCTVMVWEIDPSVTGHVVSGGGSGGGGCGGGVGGGGSSGGGGGSSVGASSYGSNSEQTAPVCATPIHTLTGHDDAVTCVAASPEMDLVVSASHDSVVVHTLYNGTYVRTIDMLQHASPKHANGADADVSSPGKKPLPANTPQASTNSGSPPQRRRSGSVNSSQHGSGREPVPSKGKLVSNSGPAPRIHWVGISQQGYILTYSRDDCCLCSFEVNGTLLRRESAGERLHAFLLSEDGKVLLTGGQGRKVVWRWVHDLSLANDGPRKGFAATVDGSCEQHKVPPFPVPIRSLAMSEHERHLMVGLDNGLVYLLAPDSNYLRQRLQKQLEYLGFY